MLGNVTVKQSLQVQISLKVITWNTALKYNSERIEDPKDKVKWCTMSNVPILSNQMAEIYCLMIEEYDLYLKLKKSLKCADNEEVKKCFTYQI